MMYWAGFQQTVFTPYLLKLQSAVTTMIFLQFAHIFLPFRLRAGGAFFVDSISLRGGWRGGSCEQPKERIQRWQKRKRRKERNIACARGRTRRGESLPWLSGGRMYMRSMIDGETLHEGSLSSMAGNDLAAVLPEPYTLKVHTRSGLGDQFGVHVATLAWVRRADATWLSGK